MVMEQEGILKSKYNEAGYQILRLHELWNNCERFAHSGDLQKWHWALDSIWRELYADVLKQPEELGLIEENKGLRNTIQNAKTPREKYEALNERHLFLKKIQDMAGKGGIYSDGTEEDFE